MLDVELNMVLLKDIDRLLNLFREELIDAGLSVSSIERIDIDVNTTSTDDLVLAKTWLEEIYDTSYMRVLEVRAHHDPQTWENFKLLKIKGLEEQKLLKLAHTKFKKDFLYNRPSVLFKLQAGYAGLKREANSRP